MRAKTHYHCWRLGIMGICTAYYLVKHPSLIRQEYHISIVESKRVAGGACGKAGGLLALWAFPQQLGASFVPVAPGAFRLVRR